MKKILVTSALPYANGSLHLGHLVETIQTDIWVRFQKHIGNECYYICADDTHGTPIMLSAKKQGVTPEELIAKIHAEHIADFQGFGIDFDNYYTTNSDENKYFAELIYQKAKDKGAIYEKDIDQLFCPQCQMFLPDRFIKGQCPICKAEDQYGDSCEQCSATYTITSLINPRCAECQSTPIIKKSTHHFFKLSEFTAHIKAWLDTNSVKPEIRNKLQEWFDTGIKDWDISRDEPYFGFKIPGTSDKYFYVWLDAPVGYISTTQNWCKKTNRNFDNFWKKDEFEIHHFIGKDILYFHTLFWPAMLMVSEFSLPTKVHVHGFLTINGLKMSKSRGTFINAKTYLNTLNPEFLRYYFASKLTSSIEDLDLSFNDFVLKTNSDIVNKLVNIGSRLGSIVNKKLDNRLTQISSQGQDLIGQIRNASNDILGYYQNLEYAKAIKEIMHLADAVNKYIDESAPWAVIKEDPAKAALICTDGLNALRLLTCYLKPVIPKIAAGVEQFLNIAPLKWTDLTTEITDCPINKYEHLAQRLDLEVVLNAIKG